jgi:cation diffusion facilitator CzcD-associated flavoprotein CzcO
LANINLLAARAADPSVEVPGELPAQAPIQSALRYAETSIYPYLESNVDARAMEFSQEPIPVQRSQRSISLHGSDTPFRPHEVIRQYIEGLVNRNGYQDLIEYNTTVERASKNNGEWELILRRSGEFTDYWWTETFDAIVVANGHYTVPYFPHIDGLQEFEERYPGSVEHSKAYRGREKYRGRVCKRNRSAEYSLTLNPAGCGSGSFHLWW